MRWSVPIVVVALAACILAGSLGFQDTIKETTEYESVLSDLAPIADAGPVTESVNYNPLTNVTGWSGGVSFITQREASLYRAYEDNTITTITGTVRMNNPLDTEFRYGPYNYTVAIPEPEASLSYEWEYEVLNPNISVNTDLNRYHGNQIGGWIGSTSYTYTVGLYEIIHDFSAYYSVEYPSDPMYGLFPDNEIYFMRLGASYPDTIGFENANVGVIMPEYSIVTASANYVQGTGLVGITSWNGAAGYSYTFTDEEDDNIAIYSESVTNTIAYTSPQLHSGEFILVNGAWYKVTGYNDDGAPVWDDSISAPYMLIMSKTMDYSLTYKTWARGDVYYIAPYSTMTVSTASWANGQYNESVVMVADASGLTYSLNGAALPAQPLTSVYPDMAAWAGGYTGMVQITINSDGTAYWQGITAYSDTHNYTVSAYRYLLASPYTTSAPIQTIMVSYLGTPGHVAVVDTWVPRDGQGLLWDNATFPIDAVFSSLWASENLRIKFNSFVVTGSGLTINGETYAVADGNITLDNETFKIAGSSIEWTPAGDTVLVAPNGDRYDLGTRTGTFTLNGVWYGVLSLDTFETVQAPAKEAVFGVIPDIGWLAWVFVGVLVIGTVGVLATGRQLDMMDLLALGIVGLAGVVMAVI